MAIVALLGAKAYVDRPYDLGSRLHYIGAKDYGCFIICWDRPSSEYYFTTDMTQEEKAVYFKKATLESVSQESGGLYSYIKMRFIVSHEPEAFYIEYYDQKESVVKDLRLVERPEPYLVSISTHANSNDDPGDHKSARAALE